ncbi:site-specific integrase [Serpentinicella alkaliphila]|uniref:site-specific integrase n=1 Tax=Serpentinicella alkaliphila TaxID=1734049 RepID=UPI001BC83008
MKINYFQQLLSSYFLKHIPERTNYSDNTIKSYRDTFILLFQYQEEFLNKSISKMRLETLSRKYLEDFLVWLEKEKQYSVSSINHRLSDSMLSSNISKWKSPSILNFVHQYLILKLAKYLLFQ